MPATKVEVEEQHKIVYLNSFCFTLFFYSTLVAAPVVRQVYPTQEGRLGLGLGLQMILSYKIIKSQS